MKQNSRPLAHSWCSFSVLALAALLSVVGCNKADKPDDDSASSAAEPVGSGEHRAKREMPPAAFDACTGKAAGDACTVQMGDKSIEATCAAAADGRLACHPQRGEHKKPE